MGARSIRRAGARRHAKALRREAMLRRRSALAAGAALGALAVAPSAHAAVYEVTNLDDAGAGSLRQAIADADADAAHDTIVFASGLSGQIDLVSPLHISTSMTIEGPGADAVTLDGGGTVGIFAIDTAVRGEPVSISGFTMTRGRATDGGAIYAADALLTVRDSVITGNTATATGGGITARNGGLVISGSEITDNTAGHYGGGVHYDGIWSGAHGLSITDTIVSGNEGWRGGGLSLYDVYADAEIARVTVTGNTSARDGGGVWFEDTYSGAAVTVADSTIAGNTSAWAGGGISFGENFTGPTRVVDSTIVDNTAAQGGGIQFADVNAAGSFAVIGSTITGNTATDRGGGIFRGYGAGGGTDTPLEVTSTVVADNSAVNGGPDISQSPSAIGDLTLGNSLLGDPSGAAFVETPNGNLFGVDPQLGPLTDNGGPTQTRLPEPTSPLLDAGLAAGQSTDQRGETRTVELPDVPNQLNSDGTDIGAVERQLPPPPPPPPSVSAVAPVVLSSTPLSGPAGTAVTIRGGSFADTAAVSFGDTPAQFIVDGQDQITAIAPDGLSGTVAITVLTAAGRSAPTPAGQFTYTPAPTAASDPSGPQSPAAELVCAHVPSLIGRTLRAARRLLDRADCHDAPLHRKGTRPPKGRKIVAQQPAAGTPLHAGQRITVKLEPRRRAKR